MRTMADDLVSTGLAAVGYRYLAVDGAYTALPRCHLDLGISGLSTSVDDY